MNFRRAHGSVFPGCTPLRSGLRRPFGARRWSSTSPVPVWNSMVRPTNPPRSETQHGEILLPQGCESAFPVLSSHRLPQAAARSHGQRVRSAEYFDLYLRSGRAEGFHLPGQVANREIDIAVTLRRPAPLADISARLRGTARRAQARAPERHPHTRAQNGLQDRRRRGPGGPLRAADTPPAVPFQWRSSVIGFPVKGGSDRHQGHIHVVQALRVARRKCTRRLTSWRLNF